MYLNVYVFVYKMVYAAAVYAAKAALLFWSLVIFYVARCYLWLFTFYINIKIGKNSC